MFPIKRELTPVTRYPLAPFDALHRQMDRLFADFTNGGSLARWEALTPFEPSIDVVETDTELKVTAELPGLEQKDVEVELANDFLTLRGKKEEQKEDKTDTWYRRERSFGSFERSIALPWSADTGKTKAEATFKNGVLTVKVAKPKEAQERTKRLEIKAA